ncbi:MAG: YwmB family TATA-box binding protein [Clostridia bacterium]|nr:YwmB family TATA-box binding protein [Clostridia bacterium]
MYWHWFKSLRYNFKLFLLFLLLLSFSSGMLLSRQLFAGTERQLLPDSQAAIEQEYSSAADPVPGMLLTAVAASGARLDSVNLEAWASLKPDFLSAATVQQLARQVARALGLDLDAGLTEYNEENFHAVFWEGEIETGVKLYFSLQSLKGSEEDSETYLLVNLAGNPSEGEGQLIKWRQKVEAAFSPWQVQPQLTYSLTGVIPGKLSPVERKQRAQAVLAALQAEEIEGLEDDMLISLSAYSPHLPISLYVAGRPVNANVALRYHDSDGNTYIHLGSPLLGGGY